jgi:hypothetical protein
LTLNVPDDEVNFTNPLCALNLISTVLLYRSIDKGKPLDDFKHEELLLKTKRVFRVYVFTDFDN